jgi:flagellar biosynthetic protein FliP
MTTTTAPQPGTAPTTSPWRQLRTRRFALHYAEMLVSMGAGMVLFGWLESFLPVDLMARGDVGAVVMATNMSLGMGLWMRIRRHPWAGIAAMSAAMYVPFAVLLVPFWAGLISSGTLMLAGHALMLPAMALAMLRPSAGHGHGRAAG